MAELIYLNGAFMPREQATLDIEDRGTLYADGVYEVLRYYAGKAFGMQGHVERLSRSLAGLGFADAVVAKWPGTLSVASDELVKRNGLREAKVYWQITRGVAPRSHRIEEGMEPTVLMIAYPVEPLPADAQPKVIRVMLTEDTRWKHCWVKSLMLLPNTLALTEAKRKGFDEAVFERTKPVAGAPVHITEGNSSNLFIVRDGELWTHPADGWILPGITRQAVLGLAGDLGVKVNETAFGRDALLAADEAFLCGTTRELSIIRAVGDRSLPAEAPVTRRLYKAYLEGVRQG